MKIPKTLIIILLCSLIAIMPTYASTPLNQSLRVGYEFNTTNPTVAYDIFGINNATISSSVTYNYSILNSSTGYALCTNTTTNFLTTLAPLPLEQKGTFSLKILPKTIGTSQGLIYTSVVTPQRFEMYQGAATTNGISWQMAGTGIFNVGYNNFWNLTTFDTYTFTWDNTFPFQKIYKNGNLVLATSVFPTLVQSVSTAFLIKGGATGFFAGCFDNIYIFNNSINDSQAMLLASGTPYPFIETPPAPPTCTPNWVIIPSTCAINDTQLITYTDTNFCNNSTGLPANNGTETSCNYCDPQIYANYSTCTINNTQEVNYYDTNYTTCCLVTGLTNDCIINTPTYYPANVSCSYLNTDFNCVLDTQPILNDKINVNCEMPDTQNYSCIINIYQGNNYNDLLQTSPEYKTSNNIIFSGQTESRTSFTPTNKLLNAYYTQKELRASTQYKLEVKCSSNNQTLTSNYFITPQYHLPDEPINRIAWAGNNAGTTILAILFLLLMISIGVIIVQKLRGR